MAKEDPVEKARRESLTALRELVEQRTKVADAKWKNVAEVLANMHPAQEEVIGEVTPGGWAAKIVKVRGS